MYWQSPLVPMANRDPDSPSGGDSMGRGGLASPLLWRRGEREGGTAHRSLSSPSLISPSEGGGTANPPLAFGPTLRAVVIAFGDVRPKRGIDDS